MMRTIPNLGKSVCALEVVRSASVGWSGLWISISRGGWSVPCSSRLHLHSLPVSPVICKPDQCSAEGSGRVCGNPEPPAPRSLHLSFQAFLSPPILCSANSSHLVLPEFPAVSPHLWEPPGSGLKPGCSKPGTSPFASSLPETVFFLCLLLKCLKTIVRYFIFSSVV